MYGVYIEAFNLHCGKILNENYRITYRIVRGVIITEMTGYEGIETIVQTWRLLWAGAIIACTMDGSQSGWSCFEHLIME